MTNPDIKLFVDATMLDDWGKCREFMRQRYVENRVPSEPAIALEVGTAFHLGIESFWRGASYEDSEHKRSCKTLWDLCRICSRPTSTT